MTNHIEEMMKTAGVEYYDRYLDCKNDKECICSGACCICDEAEEVYCYPDFTAEKQLEVIKLIIFSHKQDKGFSYPLGFLFENNSYTFLNYIYDTYDGLEIGREVSNQDFTQALAQLTTELMKAGKFDKSKVKEILEK